MHFMAKQQFSLKLKKKLLFNMTLYKTDFTSKNLAIQLELYQ